MPQPDETPGVENLELSDSDPDALFDSPAKPKRKAKQPNGSTTESEGSAPRPESRYSAEEAREAALRKELDSVRDINKVIEGVVGSLEKAKNNMETVSRTVTSASILLQTWTRILSQTEHNQRLILNPAWQGASQDLADMESEALLRQQAAERREIEEQMRREAAARKAAEEQKKASEATATPGTRGRGFRGRVGRVVSGGRATPGAGGSTTGTTYVGVGGQGGRGNEQGSSSGPGRAGSGIGRALRGRGRGLG